MSWFNELTDDEQHGIITAVVLIALVVSVSAMIWGFS
jgi:hypothetical protein